MFYCLTFETSLFVASCDSQGHGGGTRPCLHTGFINLLHYDQVKDEMGRAYSTNGCKEESYTFEPESYVTTDGQSASLSWNKAPIWGLRPDSYYRRTVAGLLMWGALSNERTGLSFTIAAGPSQRSHSRVRAPWDLRPYFTVSDLGLSFSSPPTTRRVTVEVFDPASTRGLRPIIHVSITCPFITRSGPQTEHKLELFDCCNLRIRCHGNACLPNRYPTTVYPASLQECAKRNVA
jgi:hypothetical protein